MTYNLNFIGMRNLLIVFFGFILFASCGGNSSKTESPKMESRTAKSSKKISPCSLLTEAEIKDILSLPKDALTTMEDVVYTYPTCSYEWEILVYVKNTTVGGQQMALEYPYKLMIVLVANADKSMFDKSTVVYKDGENISGLGQMAIWGDGMSQVTFLSNGYMIHLSLKISDNNSVNKDKAIELARLVEKRLS